MRSAVWLGLAVVAAVWSASGLGVRLQAAELSSTELKSALAAVRSVGPRGQGHSEAAAAVRKLNAADGSQLITILSAMEGAGDVACNWLRGVVEATAQRTLQRDGKLPVADL